MSIKDELCNCEKLKKELGSLKNKFENIQKIKEKLEKNLSSLLKTARAEIARKDKMISDLRKRYNECCTKTDIAKFFSNVTIMITDWTMQLLEEITKVNLGIFLLIDHCINSIQWSKNMTMLL